MSMSKKLYTIDMRKETYTIDPVARKAALKRYRQASEELHRLPRYVKYDPERIKVVGTYLRLRSRRIPLNGAAIATDGVNVKISTYGGCGEVLIVGSVTPNFLQELNVAWGAEYFGISTELAAERFSRKMD